MSESQDRNIYLNFVKRIINDTILNESLRNRFFADPKSLSYYEMKSALMEPVKYLDTIGDIVFPKRAHTMIGLKRLDNLQYCIEDVIKNNVKGDMIETGVWRGGATIFMKFMLNEYSITDKVIYVADSFQGLPRPDIDKYPVDQGDELHTDMRLKVSLDEVKSNFEKYGVLDKQIKFLKGWFKDTLKKSGIEELSILRLDGDMYGSTIEVLENLYEKLSNEGYLIIDDYALKGCRAAVNDFRSQHNIHEPLEPIDWTGVFWKKGSYKEVSPLTEKFGEAALDAVLHKYRYRQDLQNAFPEVKNGYYDNLIGWAANVTLRKFIDSDYDSLILFKEWFVNYADKNLI